jgi:hypothetical protein
MSTQFVKWGIPTITTVISDIQQLQKKVSARGMSAVLTAEETRELGKIVLFATMFAIIGGMLASDDDEKERTAWFYIARELNSTLGSFSAVGGRIIIPVPPLIAQLGQVAVMMGQLIHLEEYKQDGAGYGIGDMKWLNTLENLVTPSFLSEFTGSREKVNTKQELVSEALQVGEIDARAVAEKYSEDWNSTDKKPAELEDYRARKTAETQQLFNVNKKYPDNKVVEIILTVDNNSDRIEKLLQLGEELGYKEVYETMKDLKNDPDVRMRWEDSEGDHKSQFVSDKLFSEFRKASKNLR